MGHGYNHYFDCNCPWCKNYIGRKINKQQFFFAFEKRLKEFKEYFSTTNPNAKCKFCGQTISFYQNSYGSRVFFDMLGKPWTKHKCYYEIIQHYFEEEIDLTLENLPDLVTEKFYVESDIINIEPKIKTRLLGGYILIEFHNLKENKNEEFIVKYDNLEFGLCFFNKSENTIEGYFNDESYSLNCYSYEKAREELKHIFRYEIGEETIIEIFKENVEKDRIIVYYTHIVKNFSKRPEAFMKINILKQGTLDNLYKNDGLKLKVKSILQKDNKIEFVES